jgi:hypothetical protein
MLVNVMSVVDTVTSTVRPREPSPPQPTRRLQKQQLTFLHVFVLPNHDDTQVPLPVMIMMDTIRRGELPDGVAVLQVMPCTEVGGCTAVESS